jgi:hypothetical protein
LEQGVRQQSRSATRSAIEQVAGFLVQPHWLHLGDNRRGAAPITAAMPVTMRVDRSQSVSSIHTVTFFMREAL